MVLPFVDSSSLKSSEACQGLVSLLKSLQRELERINVQIHLETDLEPRTIADLIKEVKNPLVRANYDIGNAASLGHDPAVELPFIGPSLGSVHVKDRILGGRTVPLGNGAANFRACFDFFKSIGYRGSFILQVARETGLSETALAIRNRRFVESLLNTGAQGK